MDKKTDLVFVRKAKELLEMATDKYGILPVGTIMRIQDVIKELEDILEENE